MYIMIDSSQNSWRSEEERKGMCVCVCVCVWMRASSFIAAAVVAAAAQKIRFLPTKSG